MPAKPSRSPTSARANSWSTGTATSIDQFNFQRHDVAQVNGPSGPGTNTRSSACRRRDWRRRCRSRFPSGIPRSRSPKSRTRTAAARRSSCVSGPATPTRSCLANRNLAFWSYEGASYRRSARLGAAARAWLRAAQLHGHECVRLWRRHSGGRLWRRDDGLRRTCGAHAEARGAAGRGHGRRRAAAHRAGETGALEPDRACRRCRHFVAVHRGDYFGTLVAYRALLAERGLTAPRIPDTSLRADLVRVGLRAQLHRPAGAWPRCRRRGARPELGRARRRLADRGRRLEAGSARSFRAATPT